MTQENALATLLEHWAQNREVNADEEPLAIGEISILPDISLEVIHNWERNGLIPVPRNSYNRYHCFGKKEIERLRIIRMGDSHLAILLMFIKLDGENTCDLKKVLAAPREDNDIFTTAAPLAHHFVWPGTIGASSYSID